MSSGSRAVKKVIVQKTINNYITNHYTTNNDNRVTNNITYNVRTRNGDFPRQWIDEKTGLPKTNVRNVNWCKKQNTWRVQAIDTEKKKIVHVGLRKNWEDAVSLREQAQKTEGRHGPGELCFGSDGEIMAACGNCRKMNGIASYAPDPCTRKKKFDEFKVACGQLESNDVNVAAKAEALLAVIPEGPGNKALRTSLCRRCRDNAHRSQTEGPNSAFAKCRAANLEIRKDMALRGCALCSEKRGEVLECDHKDRLGKPKGCKSIFDISWFATKYGHGGPDEMWKAYRNENVQVICKCCHSLQPTHSVFRGVDSWKLEEGSNAHIVRKYTEEKRDHNNKRKREHLNILEDGSRLGPGQCYYCEAEYVCLPGFENAFQWMHNCENLKKHDVAKIVGNNTCTNAGIKCIDAEIDGTNGSGGCNLGCANCHYYYETLPRSKEGTAAWDALMATPIRKLIA